MKTQITISELATCLDQANVKVIDGSWVLDGTNVFETYKLEHIPGAVFFDLDLISDHSTDLPHMAPDPDYFAEHVGAMGIAEDDTVIIYDQVGLFSAPRIWWTFKLMGHKNVYVLRGGLPAWRAAGMVVSNQVELKIKVNYTPRINTELVINLSQLKSLIQTKNVNIIDARPQARFLGIAPEPRAGLRSGHIPSSASLPSSMLIDNGMLRPETELLSLLSGVGVELNDRVITTCGSGVTAAILSMALAECGFESHQLYDGSWAQWGREDMGTTVENNLSAR